MLIHSHSEGDRAGFGFWELASGGACWDAVGDGAAEGDAGLAAGAGVGAAVTVLAGAAWMVNVRAGNVATRG